VAYVFYRKKQQKKILAASLKEKTQDPLQDKVELGLASPQDNMRGDVQIS
jgi:hypothetical protein